MIFRFFFSAVIAALTTSGCTNADQQASVQQDLSLPATLCLELDTKTAAAVSYGDTRLQIEIRNHVASPTYSGALMLFMLRNDEQPLLIHSFGMQPDRLEHGRAEPQSFQVALNDIRLTPDASGSVCFELTEQDSLHSKNNSRLRDIEIRWQPVRANADP